MELLALVLAAPPLSREERELVETSLILKMGLFLAALLDLDEDALRPCGENIAYLESVCFDCLVDSRDDMAGNHVVLGASCLRLPRAGKGGA